MSSKSKQPTILRIVQLLAEGDYTSAEIASKLEIPPGTVRSLISLLACLGIVERRTLPRVSYALTDYGKKGLEKRR